MFKFVEQLLLLFHENKTNDNKGISKHLRFCWQQLFGLLHNITISLKSTRLNKTEIKVIAEKKIGTLHHPMITAATPTPLSYCHCWETRFEILLIIADIADKTRDFSCIAVLIGNSKSVPPVS